MDDRKVDRKISQGMTEMPDDRRLPVIRPSRKALLIIIAFIVGYALGYLGGYRNGEYSMQEHWMEKTAPTSAIK